MTVIAKLAGKPWRHEALCALLPSCGYLVAGQGFISWHFSLPALLLATFWTSSLLPSPFPKKMSFADVWVFVLLFPSSLLRISSAPCPVLNHVYTNPVSRDIKNAPPKAVSAEQPVLYDKWMSQYSQGRLNRFVWRWVLSRNRGVGRERKGSPSRIGFLAAISRA